MKYISIIAFKLFTFIILANTASAASPIQKSYFGDKAIGGYDTVAYLTEGKAVKGKQGYKHSWKGANWYFSSQANLDKFKGNPEAYAPQYGGYCAWAVAEKGKLVSVDPEVFEVRDGKVYLNYNDSVRKEWLADADAFIKEADSKFNSLIKE